MTRSTGMKSLQRRLFGSHLRVMAVALLVVALGAALFVAVAGVSGNKTLGGPGGGGDGGPLGLVFGLAAAAIASGLVSWRMSRRLAAPIDDIRNATRALAAGRYGIEVPGTDTVELDALASDVNALARELRTTEEQRLRLIGDVAHELRNPLSTIEGTMEALLDGVMAADDETYARIGREAARLRRLADDLSSLSSAAELGLVERDPVDVAAVAATCVSQLVPQAEAKGLSLTIRPSSPAVVSADVDRITQVLMNVIGNAIQYTEQGHVTVSIRVGGPDSPEPTEAGSVVPSAVVEVADSGVGLTPSDLTQIFERFYRVDDQFADGTGVGLAISKLLVEAHGGSISASSPGPGGGTTIRIELPLESGRSLPISESAFVDGQ